MLLIQETRTKKLFCLMGYMAVGKDTIQKEVLKYFDGKVQPVVSTTTRPMRPGEQEGVEYYFISDEEFFRLGGEQAFAETRIYHTKVQENGVEKDAIWKYGIERMELEKNDYLITIVDAEGFKELKEYIGRMRIVPIFISTPIEEIKQRALKRGDLEAEVDRRIASDIERFRDFKVKTVFPIVYNHEGDLDKAVKEVCTIIEKHMKEVESRFQKKK